ncbi:MAG: phenylalanine--tRNA ligase subunit alpha [Nanoarchaeota archaeon]|nr:phenylalanine--tRNA ligase subunit alpha [Nanoarchaeota archaeon]MBU1322349.1 phenylalanine--tRNA ligase subunit alpha [Nanoarchaeota archaeon]MBU1598207.1 phenylalanine--tRNA ligase subunit alpha [Nanoarchaeota archaeon]MBU2440972.1 phenylalanine--tRNA ligase subunit alpha [Nanoarchaeota archaeon]
MSEVKDIIKTLHPLERKVVPLLKQSSVFSEILKKSGLKDVEVMRALQWLQGKEVLKIKEDVKEVLTLGDNGKQALEKGLPEKVFLDTIKNKAVSLDKLRNENVLEMQELNACIGILKGKVAINIGAGRIISITDHGKQLLESSSLEEKLLKKISKEEVDISGLSDEEKFAFQNLKKRKDMIKPVLKKDWFIILSDTGKKLVTSNLGSEKTIEQLTPGMLKNSSWKKKEFRSYDVKINVPKINRGKRHFVNQAIESAKRIWLDMGFKEMTGPMVQTSFWNFDALFTAQDHPVRDLQDTFYIKDPEKGKLPDDKFLKPVKQTHENGWTTGSTGWNYKWNEENAKENVLRTHTTCLSAQTLANLKKEDLPAKFFALGRCFRNETLDWSHLFEFNQTEGIVVDENANFRHLLGYLKQFFKKMGYEQARFRPAYFPYTEFSVEIDVFHPVRKEWLELGGAGIFRPEVVKPLLGIDVPVLAWGPGFDRIIMEFFKINDIRELYKNDLKQVREIKEWMR